MDARNADESSQRDSSLSRKEFSYPCLRHGSYLSRFDGRPNESSASNPAKQIASSGRMPDASIDGIMTCSNEYVEYFARGHGAQGLVNVS
jgi:hypothetical protein